MGGSPKVSEIIVTPLVLLYVSSPNFFNELITFPKKNKKIQ